MATPTANCPTCEETAQYIRSGLVHHGDCTHHFWCIACELAFTTVVTGVKAARVEFFNTDAEKTDRYKSLEKIVGDTGAQAS